MSAPQAQGRWAVWSAGLIVVVAAGAATAHGLFEVALGSGTPSGIAWLYPVITDGLALVAYAATSRLTGSGRRYAWAVVVLAAGLSGLAQATYLAGTVGTAPVGLRFGVGAWPAVAAAIAAHLLFLIGAGSAPTAARAPSWDVPPSVNGRIRWDTAARPIEDVQLDHELSHEGDTNGCAALADGREVGQPSSARRPLSQADRARAIAALEISRTGRPPSIRELAELADVGRGTAARALASLQDAPSGLHAVINEPEKENDQ